MVKIETMYDFTHEQKISVCDAEGGRVYIDGKLVFEHIPRASCFGSESYAYEALLVKAIEALGHSVEVKHV